MSIERYSSYVELQPMVEATAHAGRVGFFFDYDGVWAPIVSRPEDAAPTDETMGTLGRVTALPGFTSVGVSGRKYQDLEAWLSPLGIEMSAEHGVLRRTKAGEWVQQAFMEPDARDRVTADMERAMTDVPGSHIEEKRAGLAWHYRVPVETHPDNTDAIVERAQRLAGSIQQIASVQLIPGHMVVDAQPGGVSKGQSIQYWLKPGAFDVVIAIGDDTTDETMLQAIKTYAEAEGIEAFDIAVGDKIPASLRLRDPQAVRELFDRVAYRRHQVFAGE
jgi:trehalose 6-phosphate synthase/phosphatase